MHIKLLCEKYCGFQAALHPTACQNNAGCQPLEQVFPSPTPTFWVETQLLKLCLWWRCSNWRKQIWTEEVALKKYWFWSRGRHMRTPGPQVTRNAFIMNRQQNLCSGCTVRSLEFEIVEFANADLVDSCNIPDFFGMSKFQKSWISKKILVMV